MRTSRVLIPAAALALALAGCSSSEPDTVDPGELASTLAAQASSSAAAASSAAGEGGAGGCADAPRAAKAALAGQSYQDVTTKDGCATLTVVTELTDPDVGKSMCDNVAGEVWQLGVKKIVVTTPTGTPLATGTPTTGCTAG